MVAGFDWQAGRFDAEENSIDGVNDIHGHWKNVPKPLLNHKDDNVNLWELIAVWQALVRVAESSRNAHLLVMTDNTQVVAMVNGTASVNESCLELLREIFWLSAIHNVYVTARYIPGIQNIIADKLSRLPVLGYFPDVCKLLCCSVDRIGDVGSESGPSDFVGVGGQYTCNS